MKASCTLVASVLAASTAALTTNSSSRDRDVPFQYPCSNEGLGRWKGSDSIASSTQMSAEKFAPRFDGLRFIETLVTAHR